MQLHLATDNKFIDYFISRQRTYFPETECKYVIITNNKVLTHVKSEDIEICNETSDAISALFKIEGLNAVYIHFFKSLFHKPVLELPGYIKLYWMFWGAEAFAHSEIYFDYLDKYSKIFYRKYNYAGKRFKLLHRGIFLPSTWMKKRNYIIEKRITQLAFRRVDYFCHYIYEDYKILKKRFGLKAEFIDFNYCSIQDLLTTDIPIRLNDKIAFLGNSANESNNHITMFLAIKNSGVGFEKLICPLSYSGQPQYINMVEEFGKEIFGDQFFPLTKFLPKEEYDKLLNEAGVFFHNHYRSQAFGNIAYQLYIGGKVYLNHKSSLYRYLSSHNINLGCISNKKLTTPVSVETNRANISRILSEDIINTKFEVTLAQK